MDYDDLWDTMTSQQSWFEKAPAEQREWLEGLADEIVKVGTEPVWRSVHRRFAELFGEAPTESTLCKHVRRLVAKRG